MSNIIFPQIKTFSGSEIVPYSSVYNDKAISELGLLPSYVNDLIKTTLPRYVHGFEILGHEIVNNQFFTCQITPGCVILDGELVFIKSDINVSVPISQSWNLSSGYLLVDVTRKDDNYSISLFFVDDIGNVYPDNFEFDVDAPHVIVAIFVVKHVSGNLGSVDMTKKWIRKAIRIKSKTFYVYGYYPIGGSGYESSEELLNRIVGSLNIEVSSLDEERIQISLVNLEDAPVNYQPTNYQVQDSKLSSHLQAIDYALASASGTNIYKVIYGGDPITLPDNIDDYYDNLVVMVSDGLPLQYGTDYEIVSGNTINILSDSVIIGDEIIAIYVLKEG